MAEEKRDNRLKLMVAGFILGELGIHVIPTSLRLLREGLEEVRKEEGEFSVDDMIDALYFGGGASLGMLFVATKWYDFTKGPDQLVVPAIANLASGLYETGRYARRKFNEFRAYDGTPSG